MKGTLAVTGDTASDRLLNTDPLALLIGMLLDQQVPMEWAFGAPAELRTRLGGRLDAGEIAAMDPDRVVEIFCQRPALHRYPAAMARRTRDMCQTLVEDYGGKAERVWKKAGSGTELAANLKALPGFGEQKARIFVALLAKRLGVTPPGWEAAAGPYAEVGHYSVADIDGPEALTLVREHKQAMKAAAKAARATSPAKPAKAATARSKPATAKAKPGRAKPTDG